MACAIGSRKLTGGVKSFASDIVFALQEALHSSLNEIRFPFLERVIRLELGVGSSSLSKLPCWWPAVSWLLPSRPCLRSEIACAAVGRLTPLYSSPIDSKVKRMGACVSGRERAVASHDADAQRNSNLCFQPRTLLIKYYARAEISSEKRKSGK